VNNHILAHEFFGGFVKWVNEVHHIETPLTEGATYWRPSRRFATRDAQLQVANNLFCHVINFPFAPAFEALRRLLRLIIVRNVLYYILFSNILQ
jgi:hypothetical protein